MDPGEYGEPSSYLALEKGTEVLSSEGEHVGVVERVIADDGEDIFEGVVIHAKLGPGGHVFAEASAIEEIREKAVLLSLDSGAAGALPKPPS